MSNLLEVSHLNNIFLARGNVKHLSGGPVMALVGFIHPKALKLFESITEDLTSDQQRLVADKIFLDKELGIGFYPGASSSVFFGDLWWDIPANKPTGWYNENTYASRFLCLTRYYDDGMRKFTYKLFNPMELEFA